MIRSMTGFGQAECTAVGYRIRVELKAVNHRFLETMVRLPREWYELEEAVKRTIQQSVKRGRIDVYITLEAEGISGKAAFVDWALAEAFVSAARALKEKYRLEDDLSLRDLIAVPDLIRIRDNRGEEREAVTEAIVRTVKEAASALVHMREVEGRHLAADLSMKLKVLQRLHAEIAEAAPVVVREYRRKLTERLAELEPAAPVDGDRIAAEVALYADRCNVDEELTRLASHFHQFEKLLQEPSPIGRKLDFLLQELNREANTIGSKAGFVTIVTAVIELKAELEKIREQAQNIE